MRKAITYLVPLLSCGLLACSTLFAGTVTLEGLPAGDTDTLFIQLNPTDGAIHGTPGAVVGWGFSVNWTSTNGDWISFTGSSLGSLGQGESNSSLLGPGGYTDFIGSQGGPSDFALSPASSPWSQDFDGVSLGLGSYQITTDPIAAVPGAQDSGQLTLYFQIFNGDPLNETTQQVGNDSYSYFGSSTQFSVTVDQVTSSAPEAATPQMLCVAALSALVTLLIRRRLYEKGNRRIHS